MPVMVRPAQPLPASFTKPLPALPRPQVVLAQVEEADWADIARIKILALGAEGVLFNGIWPRGRQPDLETRVGASLLLLQDRVPGSWPDALALLSPAWLVRLLSLAAQFPTDETAFMKASIDGETVGFALWETPVDRTATLGLPSLSEKKRARAAAAATERAQGGPEDEARKQAFDGAFAGRWKRDSAALRAEALQGKPHWYLVRLWVGAPTSAPALTLPSATCRTPSASTRTTKVAAVRRPFSSSSTALIARASSTDPAVARPCPPARPSR